MTSTVLNTKTGEVENKIPVVSGLVTTTALDQKKKKRKRKKKEKKLRTKC